MNFLSHDDARRFFLAGMRFRFGPWLRCVGLTKRLLIGKGSAGWRLTAC